MNSFKHSVAIVANSVIHDDKAIFERVKEHDMVIAADGGLNHCHRMGICPDMVIGDGDSLNPDLLQYYPDIVIRRFPMDKNETDLELAVEAIYTPNVERVTLFAALEGRTDHFLSNLHLIRHYPQKVFLESETEIVFAFSGVTEISTKPGRLISFIQIGNPAKKINSSGLKWELNDATFDKYFFSLSNVSLGNTVKCSIGEGDLICCLQK